MTGSLDIQTLSADYAASVRSPASVLDALCDRIAADLHPVWISAVPRGRVRARLAEAAERRARGERQPLFGIPFAAKDNIDVAGLPTTAACPDFAYTPDHSAAAVQLLEDAGAILVGKTNLDQFATGLVGTRSPYGACSSVFSPLHVSGGSSSGSAVAVAAGLASFALGTDTAGSGRVPAAFNNIVGLKPTRGLVSARGVMPACRTLDCVSVFAGSVVDATMVLEIVGKFDAQDAFARPAAPPPAFDGAAFRFGVPKTLPVRFASADGERLYEEAIARLASLGGRPVRFDLAPFLRAGALLYQGPFVAERLAALRARGFESWERMDPVVAAIIRGAASLDAAAAFDGLYGLAACAREAAACWSAFDVMLLPTVSRHPTLAEVAADPVGTNAALGTYTTFANLLDLCAVSIPAGMQQDGLPFGVTLLAPAFADAPLGALATRMHGALSVPEGAIRATRIELAVVGAHLAGEPLNHQLTGRGATLIRATRTAAGYRLFALPGGPPARPGLVRDTSGAGGIELEIWSLDPAAFGAFVADIPPPLCIGTISLQEGATVKGFLCESHALGGAEDITASGGWRAWRAGA